MTYPHTGPPGLVARVMRWTFASCLLGLCVLAFSMAGASTATAATAAPYVSTHPPGMTDRATTYVVAADGPKTSSIGGPFWTAVAGGALSPEIAWTADRPADSVLPKGQRGGALQQVMAPDIDPNTGITALGTAPMHTSSSHAAGRSGLEVASGDRIGALTVVLLALLVSYLASLGARGPTIASAAESRPRVRAGFLSRTHGPKKVRASGPPVYRRERWSSYALSVTGGC